MRAVIPTRVVTGVTPSELVPARVAREFRALLRDGAKLRIAGKAKHDAPAFLRRYTPKYKIELFDTRFYLTTPRDIPELRFFVAYVVQDDPRTGKTGVFPRIFYKDLSLVWRSASHLIEHGHELWIGKGEVKAATEGDEEIYYSDESTTDLPLEMQSAVETVLRISPAPRVDHRALGLVLRNAPPDRVEPYEDFVAPRREAAANSENLINGGRRVARFKRATDPSSLVFARGFAPDFSKGIVETGTSKSTMYGGKLERFRILSENRKIQYLFMAGPEHAWIIPPQAMTTELSSYGVRTVDVEADDHLFVPGYEYHYIDEDEDPEVLVSQIPEGFAGEPNHHDEARADASAWLDRLPIIQEFRKKVLGRRR